MMNTEFTLLGAFEDEGVIQQPIHRRFAHDCQQSRAEDADVIQQHIHRWMGLNGKTGLTQPKPKSPADFDFREKFQPSHEIGMACTRQPITSSVQAFPQRCGGVIAVSAYGVCRRLPRGAARGACAGRGQSGTVGDRGSRHASACVSSGSGGGEVSGAWCGV